MKPGDEGGRGCLRMVRTAIRSLSPGEPLSLVPMDRGEGVMKTRRSWPVHVAAALLAAFSSSGEVPETTSIGPPEDGWWSPTALVLSPDERTLFVACAGARRVLVYDLLAQAVTRGYAVPASPEGLARTRDGSRLYVTCAAPESVVCVIDVARGQIVDQIAAGHTAQSPVLSLDERTLYVCNRFDHDVSVFDLEARRETQRIPVLREPVAAALTPDGKRLLVANHLHPQGTETRLGAAVTIVDVAEGRVVQHVGLPAGSGMLRGIAVAPDGQFAAVTHLATRYWEPAIHPELGGINRNALSVFDLASLRLLGTVLLDQTTHGGANPWAVAWTPDGRTIVVTHAGTHEVTLVEAPARDPAPVFFSMFASQMPDLPVDGRPRKPVRIRTRVPLAGQGPRALTVSGDRAYVANYFSDNLAVIDLADPHASAAVLALPTTRAPSLERQGEMLFNDGTLCHQGWQSCASCHDVDGRMDGVTWDLPNDGLRNPKSTKSLLGAHRTPPMMSLGVRESAAMAVRAGIQHTLATHPPPEVPAAIEAFIRSLEPVPSPALVRGRLSPAVERGRQLFLSEDVGCVRCHPPPLYTDLRTHDVGTRGRMDRPDDRFDTPALVEIWRTGPYLHDGAAATLRDVLTTANPQDEHGRTRHLTPAQRDDLYEYVRSL